MKNGWRLLILILLAMYSCNSKKEVDLIVTNGKVYTVDSVFSIAEAFAVSGDKIVATGTTDQIMSGYKAKKIVDAAGKFVYPGFNDAHCHFNGYATDLVQYADLSGTSNPEEIYSILTEFYKTNGGSWVLGRGWDQNDWPVKEFPDKNRLDELFPDIPVYLIRIDGHAAWCNSAALKIAGIDKEEVVDGGKVLVINGEPTGVLIDKAEGLVSKYIPNLSEEQMKKGLLKAQENCFAVGLTSVTDCGLGKGSILLIDSMQKEGSLKMRVNAMLSPTKENFEYFVKTGRYKTDRLNVNTIKLYADGALGSRGALMLEDYSDAPGNKGLQMESREYYEKICKLAYDQNFIVATHAIGDGGNCLMLDIYGSVLGGKNDRRWRIEHAQIINVDDFQKFGQFSIVPSIQATHCTSDMGWAEARVGPERIKGAYAYHTLLGQLGWIPNGTDFPVENIDPLLTFYASVFRVDANGNPQGGWHIDEGLTREETLRSMTIWAAKASFEENEKGSIEPGKRADFIILDTDLMSASQKEIQNAKVLNTWVGGEQVYQIKE
jgi:predicted amidohydrolase YtcJ